MYEKFLVDSGLIGLGYWCGVGESQCEYFVSVEYYMWEIK